MFLFFEFQVLKKVDTRKKKNLLVAVGLISLLFDKEMEEHVILSVITLSQRAERVRAGQGEAEQINVLWVAVLLNEILPNLNSKKKGNQYVVVTVDIVGNYNN